MKYLITSVLAAAMTLAGLNTVAHAADTAADAAAFGNITIVDCRTHNLTQEQADLGLVQKALDLMRAHDMKKLDKLTPDLEAALARAPDVPSSPERCGDKINLYTDNMGQMLIMSAYVAKAPGMDKVQVVMNRALPYATLGFIVGWIRFEHKNFAAAHEAYARGMRNDPDDSTLIVEDSLTLSNLHRNDEGLALVDGFLASHANLPDSEQAALQRKRGYILVELHKLDEAEAAYNESLRLEPGNPIAEGELDYIRQQRGH